MSTSVAEIFICLKRTSQEKKKNKKTTPFYHINSLMFKPVDNPQMDVFKSYWAIQSEGKRED